MSTRRQRRAPRFWRTTPRVPRYPSTARASSATRSPSPRSSAGLRRVDRGRELVPDFQLVAIRIRGKQIRLAGHEFAFVLDDATRFLDGPCCGIDVLRILKPEPEMRDAA